MKDNQTNKPLLTISLLASRKDTIRKCLDSLSSLRERVPSELIIVDTSQDEEMGRILSEYTDQVIPFTWCNDFAKARNIGLDKAKGEWFLYLDDDEWFIDTTEIEEFFLSGIYEIYVCAHYIQRNYANRAGDAFHDASVSRMFQIKNRIRFVSTIHEYPCPLVGEYILLKNSVVEHYGYIYDTEAEKYRHAQRNIQPLLDMMKKDPKNPRWLLQLIQEYRVIDQYEEIQQCCEKALFRFKGQNDPYTCLVIGTFYNALFAKYMKFAEHEKAKALLQKALADERNTQMSRAATAYYASLMYLYDEDYAASAEYCLKYLDIYDDLKDDLEQQFRQGLFYVRDAFEDGKVEEMTCVLISCGLHRGDITPLKEYFWTLDWDGSRLFLEEAFVVDVLDAFVKYPAASPAEEEEYVKMATAMMSRQGIDEMIIKRLLEKESAERRLEENAAGKTPSPKDASQQDALSPEDASQQDAPSPEDAAAFIQLEKIFLQVESEHPYILHLKTMAARDAQSLNALFAEADFFKWNQAADYICLYASESRCSRLNILLSQTDREYAAYRDYFMMKEAEVRLLRNDKEDYGRLRRDIGNYSQKCRAFLSMYFKDNAFTGRMELLPAQGRAAVLLGKVLLAEDARDVKAVSAALKAALGVYSPFDELIKAYTHLYAAEMKERLAYEAAAQQTPREMRMQDTDSADGSASATVGGADGVRNADGGTDATQNAKGAAISEEMRQLGEQIKSRIRILINQNMLAEAKQALGQLKALLPGDTELEELEEDIKKRLS